MKSFLFIAEIILTISIVEGLSCLQCKGVSIPWICNKVVECYGGESCSIEQISNEFGETVYNLGCLSNMVCNNFASSINGQTITCSECCNATDLCNSKGCSQHGYPAQRGPVCYNCPLHTEAATCHSVDFCSLGEVCNIVGKNIFSEVVYTSSCISNHACKPVVGSHVAFIGKREISIDKRSHEQHVCDSCCTEDVCNKNCTTAQVANDPCQPYPCVRGTCKSDGNTFKCDCPDGYNGSKCQQDIDECLSSPCVHGTCVDRVNGYNCVCNHGYTGNNCQHNMVDCLSDPCVNGNCTDLINGYICTCYLGFSGKNCQQNIDDCLSNSCVNGNCTDLVNDYLCTCDQGYSGNYCQNNYTDCNDVLHYGGNMSDGVYTISTWKTHKVIDVYCDMTTDGGAWTVFQYRFNGSVDFYRNFSQYEKGFGNLHKEFWLGLDSIEEIASQGETDLRIDLGAANGDQAFETFDLFSLSPGPDFTLHLGSTIDSHNISASSRYNFGMSHNGSKFSTYDHDADNYGGNCARDYTGAWWYNTCFDANLNGKYLIPGTHDNRAMVYNGFIHGESLETTKMMMRRRI